MAIRTPQYRGIGDFLHGLASGTSNDPQQNPLAPGSTIPGSAGAGGTPSTGQSTSTPGTPPGSITLPGQPVDFTSAIFNDPAFKMLQQQLSASGISDAAHLRGAIQQALIQFGSVPDLPNDVSSAAGLDRAGTQALADANPFSTLKRLQQAYSDQQLATKNQLAARGILSSGESGYQLGRLGQQNAQGTYDATNSLLGNIGSYYDQYAAGRNAAAQQLSNGAFTAESNAASAGPSAPVTYTFDPASGLYTDGNGNWVSRASDGSTAFASAPTAQAPTPPTAPVASAAENASLQPSPAPGAAVVSGAIRSGLGSNLFGH